jgi:TLD
MVPKIHLFGNIEQVFSIEDDGFLIIELDRLWHQNCLASILLIKNENSIIGVYFDRSLDLIEKTIEKSDCCLFSSSDYDFLYTHVPGTKLNYRFKPKLGILIGNDE